MAKGKYKKKRNSSVAIQPIGYVSMVEIEFIKKTIADKFSLTTLTLPAITLPTDYFDSERCQYDADRLLDLLFGYLPDEASAIIGVLSEDMFAAGRTFVFGYANLRDGMALYSTARLYEERYGRPCNLALQQSRSYRTIVHELGHVFGNQHCENRCVMHAVAQVDSLDGLAENFCGRCQTKVNTRSAITPESAEGRFLRGGAYLRRRQLQKATNAYRDAVQLAPHEARYHNDLGVALLSLGKHKEAREVFKRASELDDNFPHPHYNLGILCRDDGGVEMAEPHFAAGLARDRDPIAAHRYVAKLYEELFGDKVRAHRHYLAYLQLGGRETDVLARIHALKALLSDT